MRTFIFPGQGSQAKGMGAELFGHFKELTQEADDLLGYSVQELCLEDARRQLNQTQFTQPAIYIVNALSYYRRIEETGRQPVFVVGHSLGEYNALLAAGAFDFASGLRLVQKRGALMSQATGGAMAAILGLVAGEVEEIISQSDLSGIEIANYNTPSQIVISGLKDEVAKAAALFEGDEVHYFPLNTSGAFHSKHMQPARVEFEQFLTEFSFGQLKIPVISNVHGRPYRQEEIAVNLADQITHSVRWSESIRYLMGRGLMEFEEIGHGQVLTKLVRSIKKEATPLVIKDEESDGSVSEFASSKKTTPSRHRPALAFMYSGQGSSYFNMAKELYLNNKVFKDSMDHCSSILDDDLESSLIDAIYNDAKGGDSFDDILYTHPALFSVGYSLTQVLYDMGIRPTCVLGYSLGEYIAAVVSGAISLEDGLRIVAQQAKCIHRSCGDGGMLVVLDKVGIFDTNSKIFQDCTLAAINYEDCFVVSGSQTRLAEVESLLDGNSILSQQLPVRYSFHSEWIDPIRTEFEAFASEFSYRPPEIPLYSCVSGEEVPHPSCHSLWRAVRGRLNFKKAITRIQNTREIEFVDLSATGTLCNFIKYGFNEKITSYFAINSFGQNLKTLSQMVEKMRQSQANGRLEITKIRRNL